MTTPPWLAPNPRAKRNLAFGSEQQRVINPNDIPELCEDLRKCPAHKPTPLYELPALAERLGVGEIRVKDESQRFGSTTSFPARSARPTTAPRASSR